MQGSETKWSRRSFLKATTLSAAGASGTTRFALAAGGNGRVTVVVDPADPVASSAPVTWAVQQLAATLKAQGISVQRVAQMSLAAKPNLLLVVASAESAVASHILSGAGVTIADRPEALALVAGNQADRHILLACGRDVRGLVYALTEVADVVQNASDGMKALLAIKTGAEAPANQVRSLTRLFCSEPEDKPWYNDREMWPQYFDMLVAQRFNRFNLAFGIGYDFIRQVTDSYFLFTYPFLLEVPGYDVRVPQLTAAERDRNLEMLKYISEQCVLRGLEFHVGLWMHGYVWINSPDATYTIDGLDKTTHGPYCRDAVRMLLQQIPHIQGLTFRIHGESGVEEGSFEFWKTVFDGVKTCGRRVLIDMHTKGMSPRMIDVALETGQPLQMSPKFWGEHMGMTYHQADIRELEKPRAGDQKGLMALSQGTRAFLRYGYGDLLPEDRRWTVVHRIWPGTQRVLLWGDPLFAAGYSRAFSFCGSNGVEIQEMLSFKGRRGSGHAGNRCAYQDDSYKVRWDWQKFEYGTRVWGRMLYNPDTAPEVIQRSLVTQFGPGAGAMETALANVSRILPVLTAAHAASAGNNSYWPELYLNQSMTDAQHFGPYRDSPEPRVFGTVSPFDPRMFSTINEHAEDLLGERSDGKYSPVEVAQWIEDYASAGRAALLEADAVATGRGTGAYRRAKVDILIQASLGQFFAAKLRSGVLFNIYQQTKDRSALEASLRCYQKARAAWAEAASVATGVYMTDITVGEEPQLRGHWADRLPAIDKDIASLAAMLETAGNSAPSPAADSAVRMVLGRQTRPAVVARHTPPERFTKGQALTLELHAPAGTGSVVLHYRHVDQAENYRSVPMKSQQSRYVSVIPAEYTRTEFPLEYYFEIRSAGMRADIYPGFRPDLTNQPYFVVRSA